jgi:hypothetical protein
MATITTTVDFRADPAGPLAKRNARKKQQAPDRRLFCVRSQLAGVAALNSSS